MANSDNFDMDELKDLDNLEDLEDLDGDMEIETIIMTNDKGEETEFMILDEVEHKGSTYLLVAEAAVVDDDEADAVILKQVGVSNDDYTYEEISDEEFEEVAKLLSERLDDYEIDF